MSINIEQIIADIKKHCLERSFIVYPGWVLATQIQRCTWEEPEEGDWQPFIEIARQCGVKMVHLSINRFDYDAAEIDSLPTDILESRRIGAGLLKAAKASIGKPYSFELSFVHNHIIYELALENDLGRLASLIDKEDKDNDEDNDADDEQEETKAEAEERMRQVLATVQEMTEMPDYRQYRSKSQLPDRQRFIMRLLQNERSLPYGFAYQVAGLAEQEFTYRIHPEFTKEHVIKLNDFRKNDPKLTKIKAMALLKISRSELESIWYDFSES